MSEWQPIETAPRDGSPVWVKGYNYGNPNSGEHRTWAWWDGNGWVDAFAIGESSVLTYLVEWMPLTPQHKGEQS